MLNLLKIHVETSAIGLRKHISSKSVFMANDHSYHLVVVSQNNSISDLLTRKRQLCNDCRTSRNDPATQEALRVFLGNKNCLDIRSRGARRKVLRDHNIGPGAHPTDADSRAEGRRDVCTWKDNAVIVPIDGGQDGLSLRGIPQG